MKSQSKKNGSGQTASQTQDSGDPNQVASREEIQNLAYTIYEARGKEWGHDLDHWLEAERALCSATGVPSSISTRNQ
jgi:hypothetical protein